MASHDVSTVVDRVPSELLIGGAWQPAASGQRFAVQDPATEETLHEVSCAGPTNC
jgi:succinate-semialdehyde dehydrogenase / glutarate-semialdehyde dehydrogenase